MCANTNLGQNGDFSVNLSIPSNCINKPIFSSTLLEKFDKAFAACVQVSAIITCRGVQDLHPEEDEILSKVTDSLIKNRDIIANISDRTETEHFALAIDYLYQNWNRVVDEYEAVKAGRVVDDPLCMTLHLAIAEEESEHVVELAAVRLIIQQAECSSAAAV